MSKPSLPLGSFLLAYEALLDRLFELAFDARLHPPRLLAPLRRRPFSLPRLLRGVSGADALAGALQRLADEARLVQADESTVRDAIRRTVDHAVARRDLKSAAPPQRDENRAHGITINSDQVEYETAVRVPGGAAVAPDDAEALFAEDDMAGADDASGDSAARSARRVSPPASAAPPSPARSVPPSAPRKAGARKTGARKAGARKATRKTAAKKTARKSGPSTAPPSPAAPPSFEGGLLGAEPPPPTVAGDADEMAGAELAPADQRWINAEVEDHDHDTPLTAGCGYTLAFGVDVEQSDRAVGSSRFGYRFTADEQEVELTVQLDSSDFTIAQTSRPLRVPRTGRSRGKARFDITPLRDGRGEITATFHRDGNFVQQMTLTLAVGASAAARAPVETQSVGRPIAAAATLRPRDLGFSVVPAAGGGFDCVVWGAVSARTRLPIQEAELADAIEQLRTALMAVVAQRGANGALPFQQAIDVDAGNRDAAMVTLARAGYRLYQRLFYHPAADAQANRVGDFLRTQATRPDTILKLQVVAQGFPIPWSLLYVAESWDETAVDWERFLGMRHIIEQIPLQNTLSVPDGTIASDRPALSVSVNLNDGIDAQMHADLVARQARYWDAASAAEPGVRVTRRTRRQELLRALNSADTADQILYLYCHAEAAGLGAAGGPDASCLVLSGNERLTLGDLNLDAPTRVQLSGAPLVFINACESGELSPLFYDGFVPYFMAKGARGVVGTECKTPALFAAEWAQRFFDRFLDGEPLGALFLALRREFFQRHGNPLGLLYGVHCDGDTQVDPSVRPQPVVAPAEPLPPPPAPSRTPRP